MNDIYTTSDLTLGAVILLSGGRLVTVTRDTYNQNNKIFGFQPAYEVEKISRQYINGELKFNPLQLRDTIMSLKNASIDLPKPSQVCSKCGKPAGQMFDGICSSCRQTQLYHAKNGFSAEELKAKGGDAT